MTTRIAIPHAGVHARAAHGKTIPKKTHIVALSSDGAHWRLVREGTPAIEPWQIHAFLFAWYAAHANDTDYGEMKVR